MNDFIEGILSIILVIFIVGCTVAFVLYVEEDAPQFLIDGEIVECDIMLRSYCGVNLGDCDNGLEYSCLTNLVEVKT